MDQNPLKALICIPCLLRGGTEMQTFTLARALVDLGHSVSILCYFETDDAVVEEFRSAGAVVRALGWPRGVSAYGFIRSLRKEIRSADPDVAHVQYMAPGLLPILAARLARVPRVVATVHQPGSPYGPPARFFLRFGARLCDAFTCVSQAAERSWFGDAMELEAACPGKLNGRRHFTIPNGVDIARLDALCGVDPGVPNVISGGKVVGSVSRLSREKGIDVLLHAFVLVRKALPESHLLLVGDGNEWKDLQILADNLGIGADITWTGRLPWGEAMKRLALADVVAIPSRFEGFGLCAAEAMALGKPVVASRVGGLEEVVLDGETGMLVPPGNIRVLAEALITALGDETLRESMGRAGRCRALAQYDFPIFRERCRVLLELPA